MQSYTLKIINIAGKSLSVSEHINSVERNSE